MVMIGDDNDDNSMSVSTFSQKRMQIQIKAKLTAGLLLRTVTEESKLKNRFSWVLLDRPLPTWPGRRAIRSVVRGGGGVREKGSGGFSGPRDKPDTDSQLYITVPCIIEGFQNNILNWLR
jgi:hypothetical protein